ncbi:MAG: tryptophan synthase subunit alpha [Phycisphaerales bacterium]|nr:tryptophan synthase subunit alpha [Phycisphaerales bacterium]
MNRIEAAFENAKESGHGALLPFVCAGSPTVDSLVTLLPALQRAGASVVEIGFPYSDPVADGPTIAAAMHDAIARGITPDKVFEQVASVRNNLTMGLVAMVSVSIVVAMGGPDSFAKKASEAGFDGCIFPDVPFEESTKLIEACSANGLTTTLLVSPTTPDDRARAIAEASSGFVYLLARSGITGERSDAPLDIADRVRAIRKSVKTPIACGFGISTPEHVAAVTKHADGAIVGSALVRRLLQADKEGKDFAHEAEVFVTELAAGSLSMDDLM